MEELIYIIINFLLLAALILVFFRKTIVNLFRSRAQRINEALDAAEAPLPEAEAAQSCETQPEAVPDDALIRDTRAQAERKVSQLRANTAQECRELTVDRLRSERTELLSRFHEAFADCESLLEHLSRLAEGRQDFCIRLVYPEYINTMTLTPTSEYLLLNAAPDPALGGDYLWFPEKKSVMAALYEKGARSILYGAVLKTALGAQAATLMTMRSAYDTAEEYSQTLESEIHRLRQSEVTADVIETSGERGKGETANGQA